MIKQEDYFVGIPGYFECKRFLEYIGTFCNITNMASALTALNIENDPFFCHPSNLRAAYSPYDKFKDFSTELQDMLMTSKMDQAIRDLILLGTNNEKIRFEIENTIKSRYTDLVGASLNVKELLESLLYGTIIKKGKRINRGESFTALAKAPLCNEYERIYNGKSYASYYPQSKKAMVESICKKYQSYLEMSEELIQQYNTNHALGIPDDTVTSKLITILINTIHIGLAYFVLHGIHFAFDYFDEALDKASTQGAEQKPVILSTHILLEDIHPRLMKVLKHFARDAGINDIDSDIDPNLFCPVHNARNGELSLSLSDVIDDSNEGNVFLLAEGGLGKTSQMFYAANRILQNNGFCAYVPGYIEINEDISFSSILYTICTMYFNKIIKTEEDAVSVFQLFPDAQFIVLIDGFNEAPKTDLLASDIRKITTLFPNIKLIISSRIDDPVFSTFNRFSIRGLNTHVVENRLQPAKISYGDLPPNLQELLLTPMFLLIYLSIPSHKKSIDTAAEILDKYNQRIVLNSSRNNPKYSETITAVMTKIVPNYALREYEHTRRLLFPASDFDDYLKENLEQISDFPFVKAFLKKNLIVVHIDKTDEYRFNHEHFRDFWVAYALRKKIIESSLDSSQSKFSFETVIDVFSKPYSLTIFQYLAQLSWENDKKNILAHCLDSVRVSSAPTYETWSHETTATATSQIIKVILSMTKQELIGYNLSALNLKRTNFQDVVTGSSRIHSAFNGSLISEETFLRSTHEGAPRRGEIIQINRERFLISLSDIDLLMLNISTKSLIATRHYFHFSEMNERSSIKTIVSSAVIDTVVFATDSAGRTFIWQFEQDSAGFIACKKTQGNYATEVLHGENAKKAVKYLQGQEKAIAIFCSNGNVYSFYFDPINDLIYISETIAHLPSLSTTERCCCYSQFMNAFYFAVQEGEKTTIIQHSLDNNEDELFCVIKTGKHRIDLMECIADPSGDGESLLLSCYSDESTRLYQINLPCCSYYKDGRYYLLNWYDNQFFFTQIRNSDYYVSHRINSIEAHRGNIILATNSGSVYQFSYDKVSHTYSPSARTFEMTVADSRFPVEHALYITDNSIAALCIDRSVHLLDSETNYLLAKISGNNNGLRKIWPASDSQIYITSYDGCLLETKQKHHSFICTNKVKTGDWSWSVAMMGNILAVGFIGGIALYSMKTGMVLKQQNCMPGIKVEDLLYDCKEGTLYAAENAEASGNENSRVSLYRLVEDGNDSRLLFEDRLSQTIGLNCYSMIASKNKIFLASRDKNNTYPQIMIIDKLSSFSESQSFSKSKSIIDDHLKGRYRDLLIFNHYLFACGPLMVCDDETFAIINIWDIQDEDHPRLIYQIKHHTDGKLPPSFFRMALFPNDEKSLSFAFIDTGNRGKLYKNSITMCQDNSLSVDFPRTIEFDHSLCDVVFSPSGKLLITDLVGNLWENSWNESSATNVFTNVGGLITCSSDFSSENHRNAIDAESRLGKALLSFNNNLYPVIRPPRIPLRTT